MKRRLQNSRGVALVIVLVIIVLVTALVVAFTAKSRTSASATSSFSNGLAADFLAKDAVSTVIAGLQREMETNSISVSSEATVWVPKTATDYLPRIDADSPYANLLKTGTAMPGGAGPDWLSAIDTSSKSLNGRYFSRARWNAPGLLTPAQATNSSVPLPKWFYLDENRNSSALPAGWRKKDFDPVGRYAFRVYDISGLLDINAVGLPTAASSDTATQKAAQRKGTLAWIDAAASGLAGLNNSHALADWRGPTQNYASYVTRFGQPYGFLVGPPASLDPVAGSTSTPVGSFNRVFSRQDLQALLKAQVFAGQFKDDGSAFLTQTTVFSREVNAPSTTVLNQAGAAALSSDLANVATNPQVSSADKAFNPFAPAVLVPAGQSFVRRDGTVAKEKEPLVKTRFPLSKINLFSVYKSTASTAAQKADALSGIEKYFCLKPNSDGTWRYIGGRVEDPALDPTTGDPKRERLKTFAEVAAGAAGNLPLYDPSDTADKSPREPNFFEYLQAAILGDSLGQGSTSGLYSNEWSDTDIARQILRIGVNLIDQYDDDDDPTVIERTELADLDPTQVDPDISGVENLPYVQVIGESSFRRFDNVSLTYLRNANPKGTYPVYPKIATYYQFQIWNPHRNATNSSGQFRIVANGTINVYLSPPDSSGGQDPLYALTTDISAPQENSILTPGTHWITFSVPATSTFATPHLLAASDPSTGVSQGSFRYTATGISPATHADILGFWCGDVDAPYNGFTHSDVQTTPGIYFHQDRYGAGAHGAAMHVDKSQGLYFQLQKMSAQGQWLPVQTIPVTGPVAAGLTNYIWTDNLPSNANLRFSASFHAGPFLGVHYAWSDPRTLHLGGGFSQHYANDQSSNIANSFLPQDNYFAMPPAVAPNGPSWLPTNTGSGAELAGSLLRYYRLARLSANKTSATWYADRGVTGPRLGDTAIVGSGAEVYSDVTQRPIVLNRPFQSLSEMGYAFRDLPWKSLNFSQDVATAGKSPADAALLDFFSLTETPVRGGVLNLNSASDEVISALLSNTALHPADLTPDLTSLSDTSALVSEIRAYLGPRTAPLHVIRTAADLPAMVQALPSAQKWSKPKREAVIAALADVHNGRTWNLLIDLVAQTGKFPRDDGNRADFQVTGEQHVLVHVAIDRITGKVIDQQTERAE